MTPHCVQRKNSLLFLSSWIHWQIYYHWQLFFLMKFDDFHKGMLSSISMWCSRILCNHTRQAPVSVNMCLYNWVCCLSFKSSSFSWFNVFRVGFLDNVQCLWCKLNVQGVSLQYLQELYGDLQQQFKEVDVLSSSRPWPHTKNDLSNECCDKVTIATN